MGNPRQCPIYNYGDGEIVVIHHHAPAAYKTKEDIRHGQTGYKGRAKILLQRSYDHGQTWLHENEEVIWDDSRPLEEKRAILWKADEPGITREQIDLASPDAAIYFPRPQTGPADADGQPTLECFAFRSADRGHTWETVPTRVVPPPPLRYVHVDGAPLVQFPDGTQVVAATLGPSANDNFVGIYGTDDNGLTWEYLGEVTRDPTGLGRPTMRTCCCCRADGCSVIPSTSVAAVTRSRWGIPTMGVTVGANHSRLWRGDSRRGWQRVVRGVSGREQGGTVSTTDRRGRCGCVTGGLWYCSVGGRHRLELA